MLIYNVADHSVTGSYIVLTSSGTTFTVATPLPSYTFSTTGSWNNFGVVPIYATVNGSYIVTVTFPFHGQTVGSEWTILNPTLVGGITLYGTYSVQTVPNSYTFTILSTVASPSATPHQQYQSAINVTGGSSTGSTETLLYSNSIYKFGFQTLNPFVGGQIFIDNVVPTVASIWNGWLTTTAGGPGTVTVSNTNALGSWLSGGSFAAIGGFVGFVYNSSQVLPPTSITSGGTFWTLDSWGNDLVAVPGNSIAINYPGHPLAYQPIYTWDPTINLQAMAIPQGPVALQRRVCCDMPERQIIAWGSHVWGNYRPSSLIRWCDVNNFNTWVAQITNQAGSVPELLQAGAAIIGARQVQQQGLIWTDIELWAMQYISQPLVYGFNKIGVGCGLIGKYAHGVMGGIVYWMGKTQIWMLERERRCARSLFRLGCGIPGFGLGQRGQDCLRHKRHVPGNYMVLPG